MDKLVLTMEELEIQTALGMIGISLPQEYIIRIKMVQEKAKEIGIGSISISDGVNIERAANAELRYRIADAERKEKEQQSKE